MTTRNPTEADLPAEADRLASEAHALNENTLKKLRVYNRTFIGVCILILIAVVAGFISTIAARNAAEKAAQASRVNGQSLAILRDFQSPTGCARAQGNYQTAVAIWKLEAFVAKVHGVSPPLAPKPPSKCHIKGVPEPTPTRTVIRTITKVVPGPTRTVTICRTPSGKPC